MANILIIDDDRLCCDAISSAVRLMGHEVSCLYTLQRGLDAARSGSFDIVFLDVKMPDGNGLDILPSIRETSSAPEVIIITGFATAKDIERALKNGAWDYIEKPCSLQEITLPLVRALKYREEKQKGKTANRKREPIIGARIESRLGVLAEIMTKSCSNLPISRLKTVHEKYPGSAIMDNLTLSCAVRLVTQRKGVRSFYPTLGVESHRRDKWDYDLNVGFRIGVDFACLAQVVQAVVLFDKIFVDPSHIDRWGRINLKEGSIYFRGIGGACGPSPCLVPLEITSQERVAYLKHATSQAYKYSETDAFKEFLHLISLSSFEAAFIHMSHSYFQTGYSDTLLFPLEELKKDTLALRDKTLADWHIEILRNDTENLLERTAYYRGDIHDKKGAGTDILRNVIAAYFFKCLSEIGGLPYLPHPLRSHFVAFDIVASNEGLPSTAERIMKIAEDSRIDKADLVNSFYGKEVVQLKIPFFLAMVLQKATTPGEIFDLAIQIRETKEARAFRNWILKMDEQILAGRLNIKNLRKEIKEVQVVLDEWRDHRNERDPGFSVDLKIGLGLLSITKRLSLRSALEKIKRPRHLQFLQSLIQASDLTPRFETLIAKTFGKDIASSWAKYRQAIESFRSLEIKKKNIRYSPLSRTFKT